jgi:hypothetical protein
MLKGRARNMFPGGNTSKGFFSFFDYIIDRDRARRIFILKGGPGVGKSTLMKKISKVVTELGIDVEHLHCSSDPGSLDALVIPGWGTALIDGTAPHMTDPKTPGAVDEIINLGEFWNEAGISENRNEIIKVRDEISDCFARAYRYLGAALKICEDTEIINQRAMDRSAVSSISWEFSDMLFDMMPPAAVPGHERRMFASAITPDGLVNFLDDLMTLDSIYVLEGFPGAGTEKVLERIKSEALERGFDAEAFYCAFRPDKLEHLILPGLNTAFTTVNSYHATDACAVRKVDFRQMLDESRIENHLPELEYNRIESQRLINKALEILHKEKQLHDELESYYIPYMDFDAINNKQQEIIKRILDYSTP